RFDHAPLPRSPPLHAPIAPPHRALRDLHSFPTRRSSDLSQRKAHSPKRRRAGQPVSESPCSAATPPTPKQTGRLSIAKRFRDGLDRKSTRLNSSHVKISYAVFCLKKKNHHKDHDGELRDK